MKEKRENPLKWKENSESIGIELEKQAIDFISFMPGTSELLFYYVLLARVKSYLIAQRMYPNFMLVIIGPPGHLKTTLARLYGLWLEEENIQEIMFMDIAKQKELAERIEKLEWLNLIVDDMHEVMNDYRKGKQIDMLDYLARHCDSKYFKTNIIVTAESIPNKSIFSTCDRMFPIYIQKKNAKELQQLKNSISNLPENFMSQLAQRFSKVLMENSDEVQKDIREFLRNYTVIEELDATTRLVSHMQAIQIVEFLYRKYICNGDETLSMKSQFNDSIKNHALKINKQLQVRRLQEENQDYVEIIYNILSMRKFIKLEGMSEDYVPQDDNFALYNGKFYITSGALQRVLLLHLQRTVSMKAVTDSLHDAGVLEEDKDARTKKFQGKRHYVISRAAMELYCKMKDNSERYL